MHLLPFLYPILLFTSATSALRSDKIKLSNVQSLTLRKDLKTSHRRVSPIPQLKCIGGSGCPYYQVDVMRCKNSGSDYSSEDIQWTCTASLPPEFKLGSTDVICEGYDGPEDPYVLKGSCGVEYRLLLTEAGEKKFGKGKWWGGDSDDDRTTGDKATSVLFWIIFIGVALWIAYSAFSGWANGERGAGIAGGRPGWGGGGGGGWGGGGGDDDPPPPYDWRPSPKPRSSYSQGEGWRPGFWSGALGGAAAGYMAGRGGRREEPRQSPGFWGGGRNSGWGNSGGSGWFDNGEGSSRSGSGSSVSSARYESTGFGSTSRR